MDAFGFMFLAVFCAAAWVIGAIRPRAFLWIRVSACLGVPLLAVYFFWVLAQAQPSWTSAHVEAGWPVVALMAIGICSALAKPKPPRPPKTDGGKLSA